MLPVYSLGCVVVVLYSYYFRECYSFCVLCNCLWAVILIIIFSLFMVCAGLAFNPGKTGFAKPSG